MFARGEDISENFFVVPIQMKKIMSCYSEPVDRRSFRTGSKQILEDQVCSVPHTGLKDS